MDSSKVKPNWLKIKAAYQRGEGSIRELAERFGVADHKLEKISAKEKWVIEKAEISGKVAEKVVNELAVQATAWVKETLERCSRYRRMIDSAINQAAAGDEAAPAIDAQALDNLMKSEKRVDDMARRALGLSDAPQTHSVNGQIGFVFDENFQRKVSEAWGTGGEGQNE